MGKEGGMKGMLGRGLVGESREGGKVAAGTITGLHPSIQTSEVQGKVDGILRVRRTEGGRLEKLSLGSSVESWQCQW